MEQTIEMKQTDHGTTVFETEAPATLYRRGSPPKCTNIDCAAKIQCYAYPDGWEIGIWAEGIHIKVSVDDIAAIVAHTGEMLRG